LDEKMMSAPPYANFGRLMGCWIDWSEPILSLKDNHQFDAVCSICEKTLYPRPIDIILSQRMSDFNNPRPPSASARLVYR
jgi:hypothetical protein